MTGISPRDVVNDMATDMAKRFRIGCCEERRKPCGYHEGWGDGIEAFCRLVFSSEPIQ